MSIIEYYVLPRLFLLDFSDHKVSNLLREGANSLEDRVDRISTDAVSVDGAFTQTLQTDSFPLSKVQIIRKHTQQ